MSREWKPGDEAIRTYFGKSNRTTLVAGCNQHNELGPHWHHFGGGWDNLSDDDGPTYRPLVVIDAEDREQVERLLDAYDGKRGGWDVGQYVDRLQAALREFANPTPPKPACTAVLHIGSERIECERDDDDHSSDHRNDSIRQGVRWSA